MCISNADLTLTSPQGCTHHAVDIDLVSEGDAGRATVERFIKGVFRHAYGARISHYLPYLLSMRQDNKMLAALGIRPAGEGALFLETYLDTPIENRLAAQLKCPIDRERIVEVGNLSSTHGGGARALIITLTAYLKGAGYDWTVFTATPKVRNNFLKLGIKVITLATADKARLNDGGRQWGSYYDQAPLVVAVSVDNSAEMIRAAMAAEQLFPTADQLWNDAVNAGRKGRLWLPPRALSAQWPDWALPQDAGLDG